MPEVATFPEFFRRYTALFQGWGDCQPRAYGRVAQKGASPGLVPGEPRFFTRTKRYTNKGASARLVPAGRKIFAGSGEQEYFGDRKASEQSWPHRHKAGGGREFWMDAALVKNLGSAGTSPAEALFVPSLIGRRALPAAAPWAHRGLRLQTC